MNKQKLAEYIITVSTIDIHRAEDRNTLSLYLVDLATMLAKIELDIPIKDAIDSHERLLGHTWLKDKDSHEILYKKWTNFKNTIKN